MGVAEAIGLDPVSVLVQSFVETLHERAQGLAWRSTPEGLVADIAEGELLLSPLPGPTATWRLTVIFQAAPEAGEAESGPAERGRRVVGWGTLGQMQQRALDLAMYGVPGGPTFDHSSMAWKRARSDGSLRMAVPGGELRISPIEGEICSLTHEDEHGVELLSIGTVAELGRQAFPMYLTRGTRPLQIRVQGRRANLRSIDVAGVLGYHALKDHSFIVLAVVRGDILLLHVRGIFHRTLARLSWTDLMFGEPVEVRPVARTTEVAHPEVSRVIANAGAADAANTPSTASPRADDASYGNVSAAYSPSCRANQPAPGGSLMTERHRELCRRYFQRLHAGLAGRGARKARQLVLLILEALDDLREDISGSRLEIYARLEDILPHRIPGGPRNVRDCLDLLVRTSPVVRAESGKRCTLRFAELHNPDSELMRFIADEDARHEPAANAGPASTEPTIRGLQPAPLVPSDAPVSPAVCDGSDSTREDEQPLVQAASAECPSASERSKSTSERHFKPTPLMIEVFRRLGKEPEDHANPEARASPSKHERTEPLTEPELVEPAPKKLAVTPDGIGPSRQTLRGFTRHGSTFLGEFVFDDDDYDDDDAPSRFRGRS